jgi:hypothetical protein
MTHSDTETLLLSISISISISKISSNNSKMKTLSTVWCYGYGYGYESEEEEVKDPDIRAALSLLRFYKSRSFLNIFHHSFFFTEKSFYTTDFIKKHEFLVPQP